MHRPQVVRRVLMVRPTTFGFNAQAAQTNTYMHRPSANETSLRNAAVREFDAMAAALRGKGIEVMVWDDAPKSPLPDAVFPNNWLSTWADGTLVLYPMEPPSRRAERQPELIKALKPTTIIDLSSAEQQHAFLEGTGAIVFDHEYQIAYGALSPRCNKELFDKHARQLGYQPVTFHTLHNHKAVYHTNVVMGMLSNTVVICTEVIINQAEKRAVLASLRNTGHDIIDISANQMANFCGNVLAAANKQGEVFVVLSQTAFDAFTSEQRALLGKHVELLPVAIPTIERVGGGSARCMIAELCF